MTAAASSLSMPIRKQSVRDIRRLIAGLVSVIFAFFV